MASPRTAATGNFITAGKMRLRKLEPAGDCGTAWQALPPQSPRGDPGAESVQERRGASAPNSNEQSVAAGLHPASTWQGEQTCVAWVFVQKFKSSYHNYPETMLFTISSYILHSFGV